jgi:hypothetical protein
MISDSVPHINRIQEQFLKAGYHEADSAFSLVPMVTEIGIFIVMDRNKCVVNKANLVFQLHKTVWNG